MATVQLLRPKTKTSTEVQEFLKQFPNAQKCYTDSLKFIKKIVAMSISHISYLYKIFPNTVFEECMLGGVPIKVLRLDRKDQSTKEDVNYLILWIKGAFDAIEKKYLKQMVLGLSTPENKEDEVTESFSFNFEYTDSGVRMVGQEGSKQTPLQPKDKNDIQKIVQATINLLRSSHVACVSTQSTETLNKRCISMKLHYYDGTPEDYEPPHFVPSVVKQFTFPTKPLVLHLGKIESPWHALRLHMRTIQQQSFTIQPNQKTPTPNKKAANKKNPTPSKLVAKEEYPTPERNEVMEWDSDSTTEYQEELGTSQQSFWDNTEAISLKILSERNSQPHGDMPHAMISPAHPTPAVLATGSRATLPHKSRILCPCQNELLEGVMLRCSQCGMWQHAICFGVLCEKLLQQHTCDKCAVREAENCTDPGLLKTVDASERQFLCLYRNALLVCMHAGCINVHSLAEYLDITESMASKLFKKLQKDEIVNTKATTRENINREMLQVAKSKYFWCVKLETDVAGNAPKVMEWDSESTEEYQEELDTSQLSFWDNTEAISPKTLLSETNSQPHGDMPHAMMSPAHPTSAVSTTGSRATLPHEGHILCPCQNELLEGVTLRCSQCGMWQHAICFGVLCEKLLQQHTCDKCAVREAENCTDPGLLKIIDASERQILCLYRNALTFCMRSSRVNEHSLAEFLDITEGIARTLFEKLQKDEIISIKATTRVTINREMLKVATSKYFWCVEPEKDGVGSATKAMKRLTTSPRKNAPEVQKSKVFTPPTYTMLRDSALSGLRTTPLPLKRSQESVHSKSPEPKKRKTSDPANKFRK